MLQLCENYMFALSLKSSIVTLTSLVALGQNFAVAPTGPQPTHLLRHYTPRHQYTWIIPHGNLIKPKFVKENEPCEHNIN